MKLAVALAIVQVAVASAANLKYQSSLFGPCVYLGAPCAAKNTVCTIYPSLENGESHAAFLHAQMPSMRVKRSPQWNNGGGGGGGYGGGGNSGYGGQSSGGYGGNTGSSYGSQPAAPSGGDSYGQAAPAPQPTYNAPAPQPAPSSYNSAPPPPPPPAYGAPATNAPAPQPVADVVSAVGGYGETTDRPVVINEETVQLTPTEEEQQPEYKYYDTRADTQQNRQLENQKEVHKYTVQKHRINKKIYNVHRTHQHEHINTNHVLNIYRHNHPHTETEYITYVYNQYVPKKYVHYSRTDQVQEKGVEEHPTQDVVQKTIQKPPEYSPVEVVQTGYDGTPLQRSDSTQIQISPAAASSSSAVSSSAASGPQARLSKREAGFGKIQAICMCAETFVPTQGVDGGCDCPAGQSVKANGRCA